MSNAKDYGTGRSELVPSGLRAYRHFKLSPGGWLAPTIVSGTGTFDPGVNTATCYAGYDRYSHRYTGTGYPLRYPSRRCTSCGGTGRIVRRVPNASAVYNAFSDVSPFEALLDNPVEDHCHCTLEECKSPNVDCTCGFYASYSPQTNFFEVTLRDAQRIHLNEPLEPIRRNYDLPPIFAVVEASGRVLMGSKGVRSERMEVKALAIDNEHLHFSSMLGGTIDLDRIGAAYEVPVFSYIPSMVEAFPQPDLSNLLKNQES